MKDKFVYQIYPKSFMDSNADGIGDLNGITSKLDYIKNMGFDYIWITPVFTSPQNDNGYDIANYYDIDPMFGTKDDLKNLILSAEKIDLKVMFDMVFNHTSIEHNWFQEALKGNQKYQDYYIFRDQPTNWKSKFSGSAWTYVEDLDKYYLHIFDETQADLNWRNPEVRKELHKIINHWLDFGIKGFRFDVINLIGKDIELQDGNKFQYTDKPIVHQFLKEMRQNTFANDETILTVGEMASTNIENSLLYASKNRDELDTIFSFHHVKVDYENHYKWTKNFFDFKELKNIFSDWQTAFSNENANMALFWSNHDQTRLASRFNKASTFNNQLNKNKMLAMSMYLHQGTSFIFQGEELGLKNTTFHHIDEFKDIETFNYYNNHTNDDRLEILGQKSRDNCRTPMLWNNEKNYGFSDGRPWIKNNDNSRDFTLEHNLIDQNSTLSFYKHLIAFKKNNLTFIDGSYETYLNDDPHIYAFKRKLDNQEYSVLCNYFEKPLNIEEFGLRGDIVLTNNQNNSLHKLDNFGAIVIKN